MDKNKRTEKDQALPAGAKGHKRKLNWKWFGAAVVTVGGLLGIAEKVRHYVAERRAPVIEARYVLLEGDCLHRFVRQKRITLDDSRITNPQFAPNKLFQEVSDAFQPAALDANGVTVNSAMLLAVKNISKTQVSVSLKNGDLKKAALPHVPPGETAVYIVKVGRLGKSEQEADPVSMISATLAGGSEKLTDPGPSNVTSRSSFDSCTSYGYPPQHSEPGH
jgi:hypothetical protein